MSFSQHFLQYQSFRFVGCKIFSTSYSGTQQISFHHLKIIQEPLKTFCIMKCKLQSISHYESSRLLCQYIISVTIIILIIIIII